MSVPTVQGSISTINTESHEEPHVGVQPVRDSMVRQMNRTLKGAVTWVIDIVEKTRNVAKMIFDEILSRLASISSCLDSFSTCVEKFEEAFSPQPVVSPALVVNVKSILASLVPN